MMTAAASKTQEFFIKIDPYYEPVCDEIVVFMLMIAKAPDKPFAQVH